jgi:hypothetical protein
MLKQLLQLQNEEDVVDDEHINSHQQAKEE